MNKIITLSEAKEAAGTRTIPDDNADRETQVFTTINNLIITHIDSIRKGHPIRATIEGLKSSDLLYSNDFHIETIIDRGAPKGIIEIKRG